MCHYIKWPGIAFLLIRNGPALRAPPAQMITSQQMMSFLLRLANWRNEWDSFCHGIYIALDLVGVRYRTVDGHNYHLSSDYNSSPYILPCPIDFNFFVWSFRPLTPFKKSRHDEVWKFCNNFGNHTPAKIAAIYTAMRSAMATTLLASYNITIRDILQPNFYRGNPGTPGSVIERHGELWFSKKLRSMFQYFFGLVLDGGYYCYYWWNYDYRRDCCGGAHAERCFGGMNANLPPYWFSPLVVDDFLLTRPLEWGIVGPFPKVDLEEDLMCHGPDKVGMVKQPTSESSEFTMSSEDFPALPGTSTASSQSGGGSQSAVGSAGAVGAVGQGVANADTTPVSQQGVATGVNQHSTSSLNMTLDKGGGGGVGLEGVGVDATGGGGERMSTPHDKALLQKRGIQTSPDGKVTNIPASMVKDQFGMVGLLTFIRAAETDPNLVSLALGQDLTALGLNLNSPDNLYPTFGGPWADMPCRPQDIDCLVPPEYLINHGIREKLAQIKLGRYKDDVLFYMFYTNVGDFLQLAAAAELYQREWRYHMEEKVWITQAPGLGAVEKTSTYERGTYYFFDAQNWRKVPKEFHLDYSKLENRPILPSSNLPLQQPV
ncbi:regulator of gene activity isoform X1 [Nilaparvata lugens]|uniref:regulator of gene activity isoform X1 n=1 Tax=Nilaparvata lugens TaxID=108931 RepID=UPI00193CDAB8|nr:regulator of gene activity isoform X1 [Nilaparvata lugens]